MNEIENKIYFSDVIGYDKEKEELKEIQNFIVNLQRYEEIGARIPKGILLIGESGNGKTLMAKALSSEINIPFYSIGDELNEDTTVKSIRDVFSEARKHSPCVVFIDEIDKLDNNDSIMDSFKKKTSSVIRELLTQMDGFKTNSGIIVIATANSTLHINNSLYRSGRFDRIIEIRMPNRDERKLLFEHYSRNKNIEKGIDFNKLAIRTSGLCCADIDNVLNDAALMSIREGADVITLKNIETAIDRVMFGAIEHKLSEDTKKKIAIHEIGHAIVAIATNRKDYLNKISIVSRGQTLGFNRFSREDETEIFGFTTKNKMFNQMMIAYGGIAAEMVMLNDISSGCAQDIDEANYIAKTMIKRFGMLGITNCIDSTMLRYEDGSSQKKKRRIEKITDRLLAKALAKAVKIIKENKELFTKLYNKLIECNVIYKEEIEEVINGLPQV